MGEPWKETTVGELATVFDGPHATPEKTTSGPWYLSISSLVHGRLDLTASAHLSDEDFPRWTKRVRPLPGDTLFSYETRLGEAAHWSITEPAAIGRRMGILRPKAGVDPRFLTYAYLGPQFQNEIQKRSIQGATVDRILITDLADWPIFVPPLAVQRRIAGVLGALDDLIDTNKRLALDCERLAQSLASNAREQTPLSSFTTSGGLGTIKPAGLVDHYSLPAFDDGRKPERVDGSAIKSNKQKLEHPCVLVARLNPHIPRVWMVYPDQSVTSLASTEFVRITGEGIAEEVIYAVCSAPAFLEQMNGLVTGTTGSHQRVDKDVLTSVAVPDVRTLPTANLDAITLLVRQAQVCREELRDLANTRDEFLPLLLSGAVTVSESAA